MRFFPCGNHPRVVNFHPKSISTRQKYYSSVAQRLLVTLYILFFNRLFHFILALLQKNFTWLGFFPTWHAPDWELVTRDSMSYSQISSGEHHLQERKAKTITGSNKLGRKQSLPGPPIWQPAMIFRHKHFPDAPHEYLQLLPPQCLLPKICDRRKYAGSHDKVCSYL